MMRHWFLEHPQAVGESYCDHQRAAFGFAAELLVASIVCFIHGLVPGLFQRTGSTAVARLHARMSSRQLRTTPLPKTEALRQR